MLVNAIIIALEIQAIHYVMKPGEIFGFLGDFFEKHLPIWMHKPVFDCTICMTFWYGTFIYLSLTDFGVSKLNLKDWLFTVIGAMGLNVVLSKLEKEELNDTAGNSDAVQSSL